MMQSNPLCYDIIYIIQYRYLNSLLIVSDIGVYWFHHLYIGSDYQSNRNRNQIFIYSGGIWCDLLLCGDLVILALVWLVVVSFSISGVTAWLSGAPGVGAHLVWGLPGAQFLLEEPADEWDENGNAVPLSHLVRHEDPRIIKSPARL